MKPIISTTILLLVFLVSGCENDLGLGTEEYNESLEILSNSGYCFHEGQTILGGKIEIPYSIENLRKAFASIPIETRAGISIEDGANFGMTNTSVDELFSIYNGF